MLTLEKDIERLSAAWLSADAELQRQQTTLRQLEHTLSREGSEMSCAHFMELQARILQQRQRFEASQQKAAERRAQLDSARSEEVAREQKEFALRRYDMKRTEFKQAECALNAHRQQLAVLSRTLPELEQKFNIALRELADARTAAK
jgi:hypothetical protein